MLVTNGKTLLYLHYRSYKIIFAEFPADSLLFLSGWVSGNGGGGWWGGGGWFRSWDLN